MVSRRGDDIQQIAAQAYLAVTQQHYGSADISLQSGGGVRLPLTPSAITAARVIEVLPFGNMPYKMTLTGDEAKGMVEKMACMPYSGQAALQGSPPTRVDYALMWTPTKPTAAAPATWKCVMQALAPGPLQTAENRIYMLAVLGSNADGGDGYGTLRNVPRSRAQDVGTLDSDVSFSYISTLPAGVTYKYSPPASASLGRVPRRFM